MKTKKKLIKASNYQKTKVLKELRKYYTDDELRKKGLKIRRNIVNITEENLRYMIRTGKIDERIYE